MGTEQHPRQTALGGPGRRAEEEAGAAPDTARTEIFKTDEGPRRGS